MPIPLGIFATAGASAVAASSYELISTAFGNGSSDTISFTSIDSTYKHLQVRAAIVLTSDTGGSLRMTLNGVTTGSYSRHNLYGTGSGTPTSDAATTDNSTVIYGRNAGLSTFPTAAVIDILDYSVATKYKTIRGFSGSIRSTTREIMLSSGALFSTTDAVNSLQIFTSSGSLATSTRVSLYGIKG